jgi:hypothetical protein
MQKIILLLLLFLTVLAGAQQINYTYGLQTPSAAAWNGNGIVYIDTTTGTTNDIIVDLNDFYWLDPFPTVISFDSAGSATLYSNSTRYYLGTFYCMFDNQGSVSPTTDSVLFTIKSYPGVYHSASQPISGIKWGTAVTLQTIKEVNDYMSVNNVDSDADDSTGVYWRFAYPAIYQTAKERKSD